MKRIWGIVLVAMLVLLPVSSLADDLLVDAADSYETAEFSDGYAPYYQDGLYGIVRYDGSIVSKPGYLDMHAYGAGMWPVMGEDGWSFVDMDGDTVLAGPYDWAESFVGGVCSVVIDGESAVIDADGQYVVEPGMWDSISAYNAAGVACVAIDGKWTLIDRQGTQLTAQLYDDLFDFDGAYIGMRNGLYELLDAEGGLLNVFAADVLGGYAEGYVTYRTGDMWQLRTAAGELVMAQTVYSEDEYMYIEPPQDGYVRYTSGDQFLLYDIERKVWIGEDDWLYAFGPSGGFICVLYEDGAYGYCDMDGLPVSETRWLDATEFHYGVAAAYDGVEWYVIGENMEIMTSLNGELRADFTLGGFDRGYVILENADGEEIVRIGGSAVEGGEFVIEDGAVTGYRGEGGDIVIPEGVTAIADEAFKDNAAITSVVLPESLVSIGARAFESSGLSGTVRIPAGVTEIGKNAFTYAAVEAFEVDAQNAVYMSWNGGLATVDGEFLCYPAGSDAQYYALPYNAVSIESYAFAGCGALKYVSVPYSAEDELDIDSRAFRGSSIYLICGKNSHAAQEALDNDIPLLTVYTEPDPTPTPMPTVIPTAEPTPVPTVKPTVAPTVAPTPEPTGIPGEVMVYFNPNGKFYHTYSSCSGMKGAGYFTLTDAVERGKRRCPECDPPVPEVVATEKPTAEPTVIPTAVPTVMPTEAPVENPTELPTVVPTAEPVPTEAPTVIPTAEPVPTEAPTVIPTEEPTAEPTVAPTVIPTAGPTAAPEEGELFGEEDMFFGVITPGKTTRAEMEAQLQLEVMDEYPTPDDETLTTVLYKFGFARFDELGVLTHVQIEDGKQEIMRKLNMQSSPEDVLAAFYCPGGAPDADGVIYAVDDNHFACVREGEWKNTSIIAYDYTINESSLMVMEFCFDAEGGMLYAAMHLDLASVG